MFHANGTDIPKGTTEKMRNGRGREGEAGRIRII